MVMIYMQQVYNGMIDPNSLYYCHKAKEQGLFISSEPHSLMTIMGFCGNQQLIHLFEQIN